MQLQKESRYGVRLMMMLALHQEDGAIQMKCIAGELGISQMYLGKIAHKLRKANLIVGFRGSRGGYRLARPASQISVGDLVRCLEDSPALTRCLLHPDSCEKAKCCLSRKIWQEGQEAMYRVFDACTLEMLVLAHEEEPKGIEPVPQTSCLQC